MKTVKRIVLGNKRMDKEVKLHNCFFCGAKALLIVEDGKFSVQTVHSHKCAFRDNKTFKTCHRGVTIDLWQAFHSAWSVFKDIPKPVNGCFKAYDLLRSRHGLVLSVSYDGKDMYQENGEKMRKPQGYFFARDASAITQSQRALLEKHKDKINKNLKGVTINTGVHYEYRKA